MAEPSAGPPVVSGLYLHKTEVISHFLAVNGGPHHQMIKKIVLHRFYVYPLSRFSGNAGEAVRVSAFITGCPFSSKS
jgi:hypothetical protein